MILSKNHWGPFIWGYLHTISVFCEKNVSSEDFLKIKKMLKNVQDVIPCTPCEIEYKKFLPSLKKITYGDYLEDNMILFKWTFLVHNKVNLRIKKKTVTYEQALKQWTKKEI